MDSKQFLQLLKQIRKKLLIRQLWHAIQLLVFYAGALALCVIALAAITPIPYWDRGLWIGIIFIFIVGGATAFHKRSTMLDSARYYDHFIDDNRVTAAYSSLHSEHALSPLVLRDALEKMRAALPEIKKVRERIIQPKLMLSTIMLVLLALLIFNQRDHMFKEAQRLEDEKEIIAQSNERIKKKADKKENAAIKERLLKENEKLKKKKVVTDRYEEITKKVKELDLQKNKMKKQHAKLEELKKEIAGLNIPEIQDAISDKDVKKLQQGFNQLSKQQKNKLMKALKDHDIASLKELEEVLKETKDSEQIQQLAKLQEELQEEAEELGETIGENAAEGSAQNAKSNGNGGASSKQSNTQSKGGKQTASSKGSSGGKGAENSSGQKGNGSGNGSGSGNGNGVGSGQGSRDMLSIPEKVEGEDKVELDSGEIGEGERGDQFQTDGPIQRGSLRPYEEVYQDYYSSYRNGSDRADIPKDLEQIIESYFSEIDPGE
ncbi:hypothetical protein [Rossellomorea sp. NPDC077527]|uniref:hypothetical protein n=1 Tax=Rossellomorea sp. NPDC077527 TaxID=3364510 RepID=UPI0037C608AC